MEKVLGWKKARKHDKFKVQVKWTGYHKPTWATYEEVEDTQALEDFERLHGKVGEAGGRSTGSLGPRRVPRARKAKRVSLNMPEGSN